MKHVAFALSSTILLLLLSESTAACWCRRDPAEKLASAVAKELTHSFIVFSGEAIERNKSGLKFRVERVWKGNATNEIIFSSNIYADRGPDGREVFIDSCALLFEVGKKYLVYADREGNELFVSKCSRAKLLESAQRDLNELNRLRPKLRVPSSHAGGINRFPSTAKSNKALQLTAR
jgi:hypothetical protein